MRPTKHSASACFGSGAFTLIEIVVALTIVAIVLAIAIPTLKGLDEDERVRAPLKTLSEIVQQARARALHERKAYQIVFERDGIHASPAMYPYEKREDYLAHFDELQKPPPREIIAHAEVQREEVDGRSAAPPAATDDSTAERPNVAPWTETIPLEKEAGCEVLMWGDGEWEVIEGEKMRRWVFQPSGMANPARVRLHTGGAVLEAGFDILTSETVAERTHAEP